MIFVEGAIIVEVPQWRRWSCYRAAAIQARGLVMSSPSVCLSVHTSIKRLNCDKTKENVAHIFIPYRR